MSFTTPTNYRRDGLASTMETSWGTCSLEEIRDCGVGFFFADVFIHGYTLKLVVIVIINDAFEAFEAMSNGSSKSCALANYRDIGKTMDAKEGI